MIPQLFPKVQQDFVGFTFNFFLKVDPLTPFDVADSTAIIIKFRRPDFTTYTTIGMFGPTDDSAQLPGENGFIQYTTVPGDLNMPGEWFIQLIVFFGLEEIPTAVQYFQVWPNI